MTLEQFKRDKRFRWKVIWIGFLLLVFINSQEPTEPKKEIDQSRCTVFGTHNCDSSGNPYYGQTACMMFESERNICRGNNCVIGYWNAIIDNEMCLECASAGLQVKEANRADCCGTSVFVESGWYLCQDIPPGRECKEGFESILGGIILKIPGLGSALDCKEAFYLGLVGLGFIGIAMVGMIL